MEDLLKQLARSNSAYREADPTRRDQGTIGGCGIAGNVPDIGSTGSRPRSSTGRASLYPYAMNLITVGQPVAYCQRYSFHYGPHIALHSGYT
jgi:hypothetical protein